MTDSRQFSDNGDKIVTGAIDSIIADICDDMNICLDREKFEFLRTIAKTRYSGLPTTSLIASLSILKGKDDLWFRELIEDGLAETFQFNGPNGKYDKRWEGWFITKKGRKVIKEIINKL